MGNWFIFEAGAEIKDWALLFIWFSFKLTNYMKFRYGYGKNSLIMLKLPAYLGLGIGVALDLGLFAVCGMRVVLG